MIILEVKGDYLDPPAGSGKRGVLTALFNGLEEIAGARVAPLAARLGVDGDGYAYYKVSGLSALEEESVVKGVRNMEPVSDAYIVPNKDIRRRSRGMGM